MRYIIIVVVATTFAFLAPFALEGTGQSAFAEQEAEAWEEAWEEAGEEAWEEAGEEAEEEEENGWPLEPVTIPIPKGCTLDSEGKLECGSETQPEEESFKEDSIGKVEEPD